MIDADILRSRFDAHAPLTLGLEEEVMLLDGDTLDLAPRAPEVLAALGPHPNAKLEMPRAQLEVAGAAAATVAEAVAELVEGRRAIAAAAAGLGLRTACLPVHPFADGEGPLNDAPRYVAIEEAYGMAARRQLLSSLHIHVCVRGADRALAVYNAVRSHLPDLAALAACAPFYEGRDTGLASVRPLLAALLPRQGIPPVLPSWEVYAAELERTGDPAAWWWELRPHRVHATIELRAADVQAAPDEAAAIAAFAHALVGWLAARYDAGDPLPVEETWRIDERRWAALRHGPAGGEERLAGLFDEIAPFAAQLGCVDELGRARALLEEGGPGAALRTAAEGDTRAATEYLAGRFAEAPAVAAGVTGRGAGSP